MSRAGIGPDAAQTRVVRDEASDFILKIEQDRDRELAAIDADLGRELKRIAAAAHHASRRFHAEYAARARRSLRQEYDRQMSRARAGQRRRRWKLLQESQEQAMWAAREQMRRNWADPDRQAAWCCHWARRAMERAEGAPLTVRIGRGGLPATEAELRAVLSAYAGGYRLSAQDDVAPGLVIEWQDTLLDGRLRAQRERLAELIFAELTAWLHQEIEAANE